MVSGYSRFRCAEGFFVFTQEFLIGYFRLVKGYDSPAGLANWPSMVIYPSGDRNKRKSTVKKNEETQCAKKPTTAKYSLFYRQILGENNPYL